ncbi:HAMP domain-containing protein [Massilia sp. WF1]|uniref:HAMP domain-containing protein n=1 Tax=Massilia sp. WF1 TaxID=1406431 RepID=UPI00068CE75F|nr:methyl-accepting chemotaxis protein [Massilia sp. WF1]
MIAVVLGVAVAIWLARNITAPLGYAVRIARQVAEGDLTARVDVRSKDETGQLMTALKEMNTSLLDIVHRVRPAPTPSPPPPPRSMPVTQDLSSRTSSRPVRWKRPRPRWKS